MAREVQSVFPDVDLSGMLIVPTCQQADYDLVRTGEKVELEKDRLLERVRGDGGSSSSAGSIAFAPEQSAARQNRAETAPRLLDWVRWQRLHNTARLVMQRAAAAAHTDDSSTCRASGWLHAGDTHAKAKPCSAPGRGSVRTTATATATARATAAARAAHPAARAMAVAAAGAAGWHGRQQQRCV